LYIGQPSIFAGISAFCFDFLKCQVESIYTFAANRDGWRVMKQHFEFRNWKRFSH